MLHRARHAGRYYSLFAAVHYRQNQAGWRSERRFGWPLSVFDGGRPVFCGFRQPIICEHGHG